MHGLKILDVYNHGIFLTCITPGTPAVALISCLSKSCKVTGRNLEISIWTVEKADIIMKPFRRHSKYQHLAGKYAYKVGIDPMSEAKLSSWEIVASKTEKWQCFHFLFQ